VALAWPHYTNQSVNLLVGEHRRLPRRCLGAILVGRGASGERPRELIEAASSGNLDQALAAVSPQVQPVVSNAAGEGFLTGLNAVLTLGAPLSFAGALLALWLVREHEIQRQPTEPEGEPGSEALPEAAHA
jgi:hypothetical protein